MTSLTQVMLVQLLNKFLQTMWKENLLNICSTMMPYAVPWSHLQYHDVICSTMMPFTVPWCHLQYHDAICSTMMPFVVPWCHLQYHDAICSTVMLYAVSWCHFQYRDAICSTMMPFAVPWCHLPGRMEDVREMSQNIRSTGSDLNIWHSEYHVDVLTT